MLWCYRELLAVLFCIACKTKTFSEDNASDVLLKLLSRVVTLAVFCILHERSVFQNAARQKAFFCSVSRLNPPVSSRERGDYATSGLAFRSVLLMMDWLTASAQARDGLQFSYLDSRARMVQIGDSEMVPIQEMVSRIKAF